ncbi:Hypothetical_protein [Hexamita inflata]|uniref:Hypothetical_protein n=2 Tax=Hexamita inflata TaxID=28002 RepID=A0AA86R0D1_9EUKA|nr:Hypothetical protein HINF_LOCUS50799 [Hexamita inflata]
MNGEILTDYNLNNFERVTILILFVPIMLLFESVVFIKIPSDSNIQINLNSVDHNADVRFSQVFQPVVVVFADFSGLISLSEDSFKEVCKTIVGCYVQLVDLFTVLFVAFLVWFLHSSQISGIGVSITLLKTQLIMYQNAVLSILLRPSSVYPGLGTVSSTCIDIFSWIFISLRVSLKKFLDLVSGINTLNTIYEFDIILSNYAYTTSMQMQIMQLKSFLKIQKSSI